MRVTNQEFIAGNVYVYSKPAAPGVGDSALIDGIDRHTSIDVKCGDVLIFLRHDEKNSKYPRESIMLHSNSLQLIRVDEIYDCVETLSE